MLCTVRASEPGSSDLQLAHEDVPSCLQDLKHDVGLQVSAEVGHLIAQAVAVAQLKPYALHTCSTHPCHFSATLVCDSQHTADAMLRQTATNLMMPLSSTSCGPGDVSRVRWYC